MGGPNSYPGVDVRGTEDVYIAGAQLHRSLYRPLQCGAAKLAMRHAPASSSFHAPALSPGATPRLTQSVSAERRHLTSPRHLHVTSLTSWSS